jgi:hypothetical protein
MCDGSEMQMRKEHLDILARRMEEQIAAFAEQFGPMILRGQSLPAEAVECFTELAMDSRRLVRTVRRLECLSA